MKKGIITMILFVSMMTTYAQLKLKVANKYYDELAYYKAVELYQDLSEGKKSSNHTTKRTAECYRLLNDNENAEIWYAKLMSSGEYTSDDIYHYAQVLKRNKKYKEANEWMKKLFDRSPSNSIAKAHENNQTYFSDLLLDSSKFLMVTQPGMNSDQADFAPYLYDSTTLVFTSSRRNTSASNKKFGWDGSAFLDIYSSKIDNDKKVKEVEPYLDNEFRSKYHEGPISFSNNNQIMYVTRSNYFGKKLGKSEDNVNNLKLFISKQKEGEWQPFESFPFNSDEYSIGHASLSEDGKQLFFVSDMKGSLGATDIWSSKLEGESWTTPKNLGYTINTEGKEMFPYYHDASGLLYFASEGHLGLGGLDIYVAYPDGNGGFSKVENVGYPINTNDDDFGLVLTNSEGEYGYFSSNRTGGKGNDDVYAINIYEPFNSGILLDILVADYKTKEGLSKAKLTILNETTNEQEEVEVNEEGRFEYKLARENDYRFIADYSDYNKDSAVFSTVNLPLETEEDKIAIHLKKPSKYAVSGLAYDVATKEMLDNYKVTLINKKTGDERVTDTQTNTNYYFDLLEDDLNDLTLVFEKDDYIAYSVELNSVDNVPGTITKIDGQLSKTGIKIENIYYDYDKSNIRKDAEVPLNELAELLTQYPTLRIELGSHTDSRASDNYNQSLSQRRAKSAVDYLIRKGIDKSRLTWKGYGEKQLVNKCSNYVICTEDEHQLNRRTEFKIID